MNMTKNYDGELSKPLEPTSIGFGAKRSSARNRAQLEKSYLEKHKKLLLLCDFFGIDTSNPHAWYLLSAALAEKHVPGFQEKQKAGAKQRWNIFRKCELKAAVDSLIAAADKSTFNNVSHACSVLAKREPWKSHVIKSKSPAVVLRHYYYLACDEFNTPRPAARSKKKR